MTAVAWETPVELAPAEKHRAERVVEQLAAAVINRWEAEVPQFGLIEGKVGLGFALYELAAAGFAEADEHAERAVVGAVEAFNTSGANPGLHAGVAGLGWLVDAWVGEEDLCGPIDDSLTERVTAMQHEVLISLRAGLTGIGLYAARRARRGVPSARSLLEAVSAKLAGLSHETQLGLTWQTPGSYFRSRISNPSDYPNLDEVKAIHEWGSAHGLASLILLLGELQAQQVPGASSTQRALKWFWASRKPAPNRFSWVTFDGHEKPLNVFSWCTGDAGAGLPTWLAAKVAGLPHEQEEALSFGRGLATRIIEGERPGIEGRIDLCCGLSGVLQSFASWAALSGEPAFAEAARVVTSRLLEELASHKLEDHRVDLQFGLAGIAATLLGVVRGIEPAWAGPMAMGLPSAKSPPPSVD